MAKPKPTVADIAMMLGGGGVGTAVALGVIGGVGMIGGAIIGAGVALGAMPYLRRVEAHRKSGGN